MNIFESIQKEKLQKKSDSITKVNEDLWITNRKASLAIIIEKDVIRFKELVSSMPDKIDDLVTEIKTYRNSMFEILGDLTDFEE